MTAQEYWDDRYRGEPIWSGQPNTLLVSYADELAPGTALDVGSGEGADVIWLATQGWNATGADISPIALRRAAGLAAQAGPAVAARISWQQADLLSWQPPEGHFDLVSAQFIHLPRSERESLHRRLAAAVRPGGTLLVVSHHPSDLDTGQRPQLPEMFATGEEMATVLDPGRVGHRHRRARSSGHVHGRRDLHHPRRPCSRRPPRLTAPDRGALTAGRP